MQVQLRVGMRPLNDDTCSSSSWKGKSHFSSIQSTSLVMQGNSTYLVTFSLFSIASFSFFFVLPRSCVHHRSSVSILFLVRFVPCVPLIMSVDRSFDQRPLSSVSTMLAVCNVYPPSLEYPRAITSSNEYSLHAQQAPYFLVSFTRRKTRSQYREK